MFTGIITDIGRVKAIVSAEEASDTRFEIETKDDTKRLGLGASIACSGPCLTVVDKAAGWFAVEASAETLARTTLGEWQVGEKINLERSLKVGDELGGHIVTGHIDGVARVISREPEGASIRLAFEPPQDLLRFLAPKGSVTLQGVSLTVNEVENSSFGINVIDHTQNATTLGDLDVGSFVNLEVDVLARYVARQLGKE
ncbi:MAG: riboflavin synthase [Alphaproteobacteria bacterium]|nr:riboflavin synthase [Alphaproteobacteria bacterium]